MFDPYGTGNSLVAEAGHRPEGSHEPPHTPNVIGAAGDGIGITRNGLPWLAAVFLSAPPLTSAHRLTNQP